MNLTSSLLDSGAMDAPGVSPEMSRLFHKLNNQLGIVLAHAELLEERAVNDVHRAHAAQVVSSVLDALNTSREIRRQSEAGGL